MFANLQFLDQCGQIQYNWRQLMNGNHMPQEKNAPRKSNGILFFIAVFAAIVVISFIFRKPASIPWVHDYQAGIQKSVQLNKPALVCFYWRNGKLISDIKQGAWRDPKVVSFVESTFVPILVRLDDNQDIAKAYNASYDGACYIRLPDGTQSDQATHGNRPPDEYIEKLAAKLKEITSKKP
jgi:hypothetical protein